jgi:hypothetical protein
MSDISFITKINRSFSNSDFQLIHSSIHHPQAIRKWFIGAIQFHRQRTKSLISSFKMCPVCSHTFLNPISSAFSLKHWRQIFKPYFLIKPALCAQTRLYQCQFNGTASQSFVIIVQLPVDRDVVSGPPNGN